MSIFLTAFLLGPIALAEIDRDSLDFQARAEALQPRLAAASPRRPGLFELDAMTTVCRAAANQRDPARFLATLSRAYGLTRAESSALRGSCAAYLAGMADGRR